MPNLRPSAMPNRKHNASATGTQIPRHAAQQQRTIVTTTNTRAAAAPSMEPGNPLFLLDISDQNGVRGGPRAATNWTSHPRQSRAADCYLCHLDLVCTMGFADHEISRAAHSRIHPTTASLVNFGAAVTCTAVSHANRSIMSQSGYLLNRARSHVVRASRRIYLITNG